MIKGLLLNLTISLIFDQLVLIEFHFYYVVQGDHDVDNRIFVEDKLLKVVVRWDFVELLEGGHREKVYARLLLVRLIPLIILDFISLQEKQHH